MQGPVEGFIYKPNYFSPHQQEKLLALIFEAVQNQAPFMRLHMPRSGQAMSVLSSNFGTHGWHSDKQQGYRYEARHRITQENWPAIPDILLQAWRALTSYPCLPEACLINYYQENAKMGLHVDRDEHDVSAPVVSISLGDEALFRIGGVLRTDATKSLRLRSGDVVVLAGTARQCFHGVDRIYYQSSQLLQKAGFRAGGRINLTMRRIHYPD